MGNIHAVVRLDNMLGTEAGSDLKSAKYYVDTTATAIDNAQLVVLGAKEGREVYKATAPTANSVRGDIYLVTTPELFYDETRKHYLTEWENEAGVPIRLHALHAPGCFSATAEAFDGTPAVDKYVGFAAGSTKIAVQSAKDAKTIGQIKAKEVAGSGNGKYTFYVIDVM